MDLLAYMKVSASRALLVVALMFFGDYTITLLHLESWLLMFSHATPGFHLFDLHQGEQVDSLLKFFRTLSENATKMCEVKQVAEHVNSNKIMETYCKQSISCSLEQDTTGLLPEIYLGRE